MKKSKILAPIMTIGTLGAVVTPMAVLTSCNTTKNTGKDADLTKEYVCEFTPAAEKTYAQETLAEQKEAAINDYFDAILKTTSNDDSCKILQDDARFSYSKAIKTDTFKQYGSLGSYKLQFNNVVADKTNKTVSATFIIDITNGSYKDTSPSINITNGNFHCEYTVQSPFKVEFCPADGNETLEVRNFIKCTLTSWHTKYVLSGTCLYNGEEVSINQPLKSHTIWDFTDKPGYIADQLFLNGLTCNIKDVQSKWKTINYGVLYTNYFANAKFTS